jgi:hypothetical protein
MKLFESKIRLKETTKEVEFDVWQPKARLSYKENGLIDEKGRVKLYYDTMGDSKWTWQTPKESSLGWFIKLYGERVYIENYWQLYSEIKK